jgi:DNA-binding CsgD family transcriptional regulator
MDQSEELQDQRLAPDERRVLELAARGMTSVEIAAHLGVPRAEVRSQLLRAIAALGAHSKLEAVVIAVKHGLIDLSGT